MGLTNKLKPCPFCGGEAEIYEGGEHFVMISCRICGTRQPCFVGENKEQDAIEAWNRRVNDE